MWLAGAVPIVLMGGRQSCRLGLACLRLVLSLRQRARKQPERSVSMACDRSTEVQEVQNTRDLATDRARTAGVGASHLARVAVGGDVR